MEYRVRKRHIEQVEYEAASVDAVLSDAVLRRFHLRAGFTTTSPRALEQTRNFYCDFLRKLLDAVLVFMQHNNRRSIRLTDVLRACTHYGIRLYGYDDMCVLEGPWGIEEYHVTEMVEANTTFNRAAIREEEPDQEPSLNYKKTDFVQNQKAWDTEEEEEDWGSDDSEWSWYGDSDAESGSEDGDEDEQQKSQPTSRWLKGEDTKEVFLRSLQAAQEVVDAHLLVQEPESETLEADEPLGQGYESDCDSAREPSCLRAWKRAAGHEEAQWAAVGGVIEFDEGNTDEPTDDQMEDSDDEVSECEEEYVIPRQFFMNVLYAQLSETFGCSLPISAVALSALHNVSEQSLHAALTSGSLQAQIVSTLMEERLEATLMLQIEAEQERQRVEQAEAAMLEMQASFKSKELEMQQRIAELERQLRQRPGDPADDVEMESKQKVSPGKRKAKSTNDPALSKQKPSTATSIVGSLRSRLTDYSLRKKAKIAPV